MKLPPRHGRISVREGWKKSAFLPLALGMRNVGNMMCKCTIGVLGFRVECARGPPFLEDQKARVTGAQLASGVIYIYSMLLC